MTDTQRWHVEPALLGAYAKLEVDDVVAASIEAHVIACATCQAGVAAATSASGSSTARLDAIWAGVLDAVESPKPSIAERAIRRLGVREHDARLLLATPSLRASWLAAVAISFVLALLGGGNARDGALAFLVVAPVLPVAGVAAAFSSAFDPTYEVSIASPISAFRLLLLRSTAVLVVTAALVGCAAVAVPDVGLWAAVWLLPALGLTVASLALSSWAGAAPAATATALAWAVAVYVDPVVSDPGPIGDLTQLAAFRPAGQLVFLVLALASAAVLLRRRATFDVGRIHR